MKGLGYRTAPEDREVENDDPDELGIDLHLALGWRFFRNDDLQRYLLSVKAGLLEGAFGGQADLIVFHPDVSLSVLLRSRHSDFDEDDRRFEDGDGAWMKVMGNYRIWRGVSLFAGFEDVLDNPGFTVGLRGELLDMDIRNLTTAAALAP